MVALFAYFPEIVAKQLVCSTFIDLFLMDIATLWKIFVTSHGQTILLKNLDFIHFFLCFSIIFK